MTTNRWYVLHAYSGYEKKVADTIMDKIPYMEDVYKEPGISLVKHIERKPRERVYDCCQTH